MRPFASAGLILVRSPITKWSMSCILPFLLNVCPLIIGMSGKSCLSNIPVYSSSVIPFTSAIIPAYVCASLGSLNGASCASILSCSSVG